MKKVFSFLVLGACMTLAFSSCKKCTTCTIKDGATTIGTSGEVCGSKSEIDDLKTTWEATNASYKALGLDYTVTCD